MPILRLVSRDVLAFVGGCIYPLALAPFYLWPLGIAALVALLVSVQGASIKRGSLRFYLFSTGMFGVGISWVFVSIQEHGGASIPLAGLLVLLFVLSLSLLTLLQGFLYLRYIRILPLGVALGFPVLWLLREWVFTWFLTGLPWLFAGYGHVDTPLGGYMPLIGAMGVSFLVALQASLIVILFLGPGTKVRVLAVTAVLLVWAGGFAASRISFVTGGNELVSVSLVQGNIDQHVKWQRSMIGPILETYIGLTETEWESDVIVWPEAALTVFRESATDLFEHLSERARARGATLILGIPDRDETGGFLNTAVALGNGEGQYIKRRLVPFGEYVPLEGLLRGTIAFLDLPMSRNRPGPEGQQPLMAGDHRVSVSICYEVIYPDLVRRTVENPHYLLTISNDTWFGRSIGPHQHLQMAQARALENGRYMIRATNNGVTAIIDHHGEIKARLNQFEAGVLRGNIEILSGRTPYSRVGDWPLLIAAALMLAVLSGLRLRHTIR